MPYVYAGGPRLDYGDDVTEEAADCWVQGYDSGFAGKYDSDRAKECLDNEDDAYNRSWDYACRDGGFNENQCANFINNSVEIDDYEALYQENGSNCYDDGRKDGQAHSPYNEDRSKGCGEYNPDYEQGYKSGCITDMTDNSCELVIRGEEGYCPFHPDIAGCVDFLNNVTNKRTENPMSACAGMGDPRTWVICPQESNPEGYCLMTNNTEFCKTIGDLCDEGGFVKPEYPYCTSQ